MLGFRRKVRVSIQEDLKSIGILPEAVDSGIKKGDRVSGSAESSLYTLGVEGYAVEDYNPNNTFCMIAIPPEESPIKGKKRWTFLEVSHVKKEVDKSGRRKADVLKVIERWINKNRRNAEKLKQYNVALDRAYMEKDWDGLKDRVLDIVKFLKSVEDNVTRRFFSAKGRQLKKAWSDLNKKKEPLFDWGVFLDEIEGEIERRSSKLK